VRRRDSVGRRRGKRALGEVRAGLCPRGHRMRWPRRFLSTQGRAERDTFGKMARGRVLRHFDEEEFLNSYGSTYRKFAVVPAAAVLAVAVIGVCVLLFG